MQISKHNYTEKNVAIDVPFDGNTFINATQTYKAFGYKKAAFNNFIHRKAIPYAERLIQLGKIPSTQKVDSADLVLIRKGGDDLNLQGTWLHPKLALMFARWLSMDFEIWCDGKIEELLKEGYVGITDDVTDALKPFSDKLKQIVKNNKHSSKKFGTYVISLLSDLEKAGAGYQAYKSLVSHISSNTTTQNRLNTYKKLKTAAASSFEAGAIARRTLEDVTSIISDREIQVLKTRKTRVETQLILTKKALAEAKVESAKAAIGSDEKAKYETKIAKLETTLKLFTDAEDNPPVDVKFDRTKVTAYITNLRKECKDTDGVHLMFAGTIAQNDKAGMKSSRGKGVFPDFANEVSLAFTTGIWKNQDGSFALKMSGGKANNYKPLLKDAIYLERELQDQNIYKGFYAKNAAEHYHVFFDEVTQTLSIYKNTIKSIKTDE